MTTPSLLLLAALYGVAMKIADLLNEHGLKLFRHANVVFGIAWGLFGFLLLFAGDVVATVVVAMNVAFIVRDRLDYPNHRIAATMILTVGIATQPILAAPFVTFLAIFIAFGGLKDYVDDVLKKQGFLAIVCELMLYYPLPTLAYCFLYGQWRLFWIFTVYTIAYDVTKAVGKCYGYK